MAFGALIFSLLNGYLFVLKPWSHLLAFHGNAPTLRDEEIAAPLHRIYYINLKKNKERRKQIEENLGRQSAIPVVRIEAKKGPTNDSMCVKDKQEPTQRCRGIGGLALSNIHIIDDWNTTGLTLVLEDDFVVWEPTKIQEAVNHAPSVVPPDWDM